MSVKDASYGEIACAVRGGYGHGWHDNSTTRRVKPRERHYIVDAHEAAKQARREAFGRALIQARQKRDMNQEELADALAVSQGSVSNWEHGKNLPNDPIDIFEIEQAVDVPPGFLSQHLGFAPLNLRRDPPPDVEAAIAANPLLTKIEKAALAGLYNQLVTSHAL